MLYDGSSEVGSFAAVFEVVQASRCFPTIILQVVLLV